MGLGRGGVGFPYVSEISIHQVPRFVDLGFNRNSTPYRYRMAGIDRSSAGRREVGS